MTQPPAGPPGTPLGGNFQARFLAVVSHELRTPLTSIASFTESLDADHLPPAERSLAVAAVRRNTERMIALVEDLKLVGRLQTGDLALTLARVQLADLVRAAADALARHEPYTATIPELAEGPPLRADTGLLTQLIYAVVGTVASAAADRSAQVSTRFADGDWVLTVLARQAERLTDEQLMAGTLATWEPPHRRRSTAVWMLLAESTAARHDGSVRLTYDPNDGAGATVRLPLAPPAAATPSPGSPAPPPALSA